MLKIMTKQTARPKAYLSRRLPPDVELRVAERYDMVRNPADTVLSPTSLSEAARGCEYILTSAMQPIPREVFQMLAGTLRAIGTLSVGYNHIDIDAAREFGIAVFYSPGVLSDACAELGVMLLLNAARRGYEADAMMRSGVGQALLQRSFWGSVLQDGEQAFWVWGESARQLHDGCRHLE